MRRAAVLATLLAAALAVPAGAAGPQIRDARGDYSVGSQDITSGRFFTAAGRLQIDLTLAAAPGVPSVYVVGFSLGRGDACRGFNARVMWNGAAETSVAQLLSGECTADSIAEGTLHDTTFEVRGSTVRMAVPLVDGLRRGVRLHSLFAYSATGVWVAAGGTLNDPDFTTGDVAFPRPRTTYVIGR